MRAFSATHAGRRLVPLTATHRAVVLHQLQQQPREQAVPDELEGAPRPAVRRAPAPGPAPVRPRRVALGERHLQPVLRGGAGVAGVRQQRLEAVRARRGRLGPARQPAQHLQRATRRANWLFAQTTDTDEF